MFGVTSLLLIVLCVFLFGLAIAVVIGLILYQRPRSRAATAMVDEAPPPPDEGELLPWTAGALADLSVRLDMEGHSALGKIDYHGRLQGLAEPHGPRRLTYTVDVSRLQGPVVMQTPAHQVELQVQLQRAQVEVNGKHLGELRWAGSNIYGYDVRLVDPAGEEIGQYARFNRAKSGLRVSHIVNVDPHYGEVLLHGRSLGKLNYNLVPRKHWLRLQGETPPLFQELPEMISDEEEQWLLALVALEVYFRTTRRVQEHGYG